MQIRQTIGGLGNDIFINHSGFGGREIVVDAVDTQEADLEKRGEQNEE